LTTPAQSKRSAFWQRQYSDTITTPQKVFDLFVGAIIPILLLIFDPVVFRNGGCYGPSLTPTYALFAYLAIGLGITALLAWLFVDAVKQRAAAFIGGVLLTGTAFAVITGIVMLPFTLLGLIVVIGVLGFFPFLTAFVYYRNSRRAWRVAQSTSLGTIRLAVSLLLGSLLVLVLPALAQGQASSLINRTVDTIAAPPDESVSASIDVLKSTNALCLGLCKSNIIAAFERVSASHPDQRQQLATAFQQTLGESLTQYTCSGSSE